MNASDPSITRTTWRFRSEILQNVSQHPVAAPRLDPAAHGLVVRIALRQHLPLGPSLQYPQDGPSPQNWTRLSRLSPTIPHESPANPG